MTTAKPDSPPPAAAGSSDANQQRSPPEGSNPNSAQARKRRRRAPATGAAEDCHTCRKRGTSCDRRRPYCSQCLELGKECSGYRTTLTWGVGVASRGKLRGKSLPVLNVAAGDAATAAAGHESSSSTTAPDAASGRGAHSSTNTPISAATPKKAPAFDQLSRQGDPAQQQRRQSTFPAPHYHAPPPQLHPHHVHNDRQPDGYHRYPYDAQANQGSRKRMRSESYYPNPRENYYMPPPLPSPPSSIPDMERREWYHAHGGAAQLRRQTFDVTQSTPHGFGPPYGVYHQQPPHPEHMQQGSEAARSQGSPRQEQYQRQDSLISNSHTYKSEEYDSASASSPSVQSRTSMFAPSHVLPPPPQSTQHHPTAHPHPSQLPPFPVHMNDSQVRPSHQHTHGTPNESYPQTPESLPQFIDPFYSRHATHALHGAAAPNTHLQNADSKALGEELMDHRASQSQPSGETQRHQSQAWDPPQSHGTVAPQSDLAMAGWQHTPPIKIELDASGQFPFQDSPGLATAQSPNSFGSSGSTQEYQEMESVDQEYGRPDDDEYSMGLVRQQPFGSMGPLDGFLPATFLNLHPRMRFLLDFYDKGICPVLVSFDGSDNPYRQHILPLAWHNEGLQHALAALATNNMRMRQVKNVPLLKYETELNGESILASEVGKPSAEEQHYKGKSIELLNAQLADPSMARDDSVLATLLILCLFHVCDSGFSKFKTQLAGVQKLLKLRGNGRASQRSEFVGWVEMFFAWFDVMTSAVNDRELQIHGDSLDLMDLSKNLGALEQFSGCDGRLFKLIARLGRLNLLSQGRPVRGLLTDGASSNANVKPPRDYYSMDFGDEDVEEVPSGHRSSVDQSYEPEGEEPMPDGRVAFWREWRDIRKRLQELDLDRVSPGLESASTQPGETPLRDMMHISESFRYSALLYTERLANPTVLSASASIQRLVEESMRHIVKIGRNSCVLKFMLWPLFITGTECAEEHHREIIRDRCIEIQKESGFYNNVSGLELLERVWREADADHQRGSACNRQGFAWRNAMDRVDGEYIVI